MKKGAQRRNVSGRRLIVAWLALLALLGQALIPGAAMAHTRAGGSRTVELCTREGLKTITVEAPAPSKPKGFAGLPCIQCVMACVTAMTPTAPTLSIPVRYVAYPATFTVLAPKGTPGARAPPRPPGQGPPALV